MPIDLNDSGFDTKFTLEREKGGVIDDPPFHILVMGDFSGGSETKDLSLRRPVEIDRDNFDEVMARIDPKLNLSYEDGTSLTLDLNSLDEFHPDEIFRRLPVFAELRDLRGRLRSESTFNAAAREVREMFAIAAAAPESAPPDAGESGDDQPNDLLDAILAKPSGGGAAPKPGVSTELNELIGRMIRPHLVSVDENERNTLIGAVDAATSDMMRRVIHHRDFQTLEAAWRGLFFMVRRTATSSDLRIFVLNIAKEELIADLKSSESLADTELYRILVRETVETPGAENWSVVCGNYAFEPVVDDVATLMRLSKIAAAANASFVSHMRPDILGVHSLAENSESSKWNASADTSAAKLWATLRGQAESQFLGMTIPRFLARLPFGADTDPLETFSFEEFADEPVHDLYLWANGCFAVGALLGQSFAEFGWEMGRVLIQDIDGLPVHVYESGGETIFKSCAEIQLTDTGVEKLMDAGLIPLISYRATDRMKVGRFQSIADPVTGLKGAWTS